MGHPPSFAGRGRVPRIVISVAALVLASTSPVLADDLPRFSVSVGVFFTDRDSNTRVDADAADAGTDIDLEDDLGFDKSDNVFRIDAYWRFAERHRIDVSMFDLSRNSTKVIDRDITVGDTTYPIDTELAAELELNIYKADYTWSFLQSGRNFLGVTAGLYIADIGTRFVGPLQVDRESRGITAPLPVFGLRGAYSFAERWSLRGSAEIFVYEYNEFEGSLYDIFAGIDFAMTDSIALGLGVNSVRMDLGFDDDKFTGAVDWAYAGAMLYLKFDF